jgi:hypothetical protein
MNSCIDSSGIVQDRRSLTDDDDRNEMRRLATRSGLQSPTVPAREGLGLEGRRSCDQAWLLWLSW